LCPEDDVMKGIHGAGDRRISSTISGSMFLKPYDLGFGDKNRWTWVYVYKDDA